jgi:hypothetical protein
VLLLLLEEGLPPVNADGSERFLDTLETGNSLASCSLRQSASATVFATGSELSVLSVRKRFTKA